MSSQWSCVIRLTGPIRWNEANYSLNLNEHKLNSAEFDVFLNFKMPETTKTYAILRVSTTSQDDDDKSGLETQLKIINEYCKQHNLPTPKKIVDVGKSAEKFAQLKNGELGKLISKLKQNKIKPASVILLFAFSDRFSRAVLLTGWRNLNLSLI